MEELAGADLTKRFSWVAEDYAKYRPGYPDDALDYIVRQCSLAAGSRIVDVGCGTGISSRWLARRGLLVTGIEPNQSMREQAEGEKLAAAFKQPVYLPGRAEDTGLPSESADAILSAQAFHWFAAEEALKEFHRVLKPGGWAILLWNERDEGDTFTAAYGQVWRTVVPESAEIEGPRGRAGQPLLNSPQFTTRARVVFRNRQQLDEDRLIGRAFSASYAPREPERRARFRTALQELFARHQKQGTVWLQYVTSVYTGRRSPGAPPPSKVPPSMIP